MNRFSLNDIAEGVNENFTYAQVDKAYDEGINSHEKAKEHYNIPASAVYEYVRKHEADIADSY